MRSFFKSFICMIIAFACVSAFAGHRHHHHGHRGMAVGAGILGAGLLATAVCDAVNPRPVVVAQPAVVTPAPVVVTPAPVVVAQPTVVTQPVGHYETRLQNVWVEGRYVDQNVNGSIIRSWVPGHYEQQSVQVFVTP